MRSKIWGQSLNGWAVFIGLLYLIQSILGSTIFILNLIKYEADKAQATAAGLPFDEDREVVSTLSVCLSLTLTFVLTTPMLLWGAYKEKHLYLVPWLYNSFICIVVNCIYYLVMVLKNIYDLNKTKKEMANFAIMCVVMAFGLTLQISFYKIIYKLYKELRSERVLQCVENSSTIFLVYEEQTSSPS